METKTGWGLSQERARRLWVVEGYVLGWASRNREGLWGGGVIKIKGNAW